MKNSSNTPSRTKFSQRLRRTLVDLAEDSMKSSDETFISKDVLNRMKSSM